MMNRRTFISALIGAATIPRIDWSESALFSLRVQISASALPATDQLAWQAPEMGVFVHFAPNTCIQKIVISSEHPQDAG